MYAWWWMERGVLTVQHWSRYKLWTVLSHNRSSLTTHQWYWWPCGVAALLMAWCVQSDCQSQPLPDHLCRFCNAMCWSTFHRIHHSVVWCLQFWTVTCYCRCKNHSCLFLYFKHFYLDMNKHMMLWTFWHNILTWSKLFSQCQFDRIISNNLSYTSSNLLSDACSVETGQSTNNSWLPIYYLYNGFGCTCSNTCTDK